MEIKHQPKSAQNFEQKVQFDPNFGIWVKIARSSFIMCVCLERY